MDKQEVSMVVLIDLSAAFDTIDHNIMLNVLQSEFHITGNVLNWFSTYLTHRSQQVKVNEHISEPLFTDIGCPQGSCLGPICFTLYVSTLNKIISKHIPSCLGYADDHQLMYAFSPVTGQSQIDAISVMENCLIDIKHWMVNNKLKMNDSKTQLIFIGTRPQLNKLNLCTKSLHIDGCEIKSVDSVQNLGVCFDSNLTLESHINMKCKKANFQLYNLRKIKPYLSKHSLEVLVHSLVQSNIDYCNSLFTGISKVIINKLQKIQNSAARLITGVSKYEHISPTLYKLHWLPIDSRIKFKVLTIVYKALHNQAPNYILSMLTIKSVE